MERGQENMKEGFKIMIDGVVVPKVERIRVSQALTLSKLPLTLPVKCFMPF